MTSRPSIGSKFVNMAPGKMSKRQQRSEQPKVRLPWSEIHDFKCSIDVK